MQWSKRTSGWWPGHFGSFPHFTISPGKCCAPADLIYKSSSNIKGCCSCAELLYSRAACLSSSISLLLISGLKQLLALQAESNKWLTLHYAARHHSTLGSALVFCLDNSVWLSITQARPFSQRNRWILLTGQLLRPFRLSNLHSHHSHIEIEDYLPICIGYSYSLFRSWRILSALHAARKFLLSQLSFFSET